MKGPRNSNAKLMTQMYSVSSSDRTWTQMMRRIIQLFNGYDGDLLERPCKRVRVLNNAKIQQKMLAEMIKNVVRQAHLLHRRQAKASSRLSKTGYFP